MESFEFLNAFFSAVSGTAAFLICALTVFAAFFVCLMLSAFKTGYGLKKRVWYAVIAALFCAFLYARATFTGEKDLSSVLLIFALFLMLPLCFIPEKKNDKRRAEDDDRRRFVRFLDDKLNGANARATEAADGNAEKIQTLKAVPEKERISDATTELDFSHVKNVLSRLEPAALSYSDRRQIHDLETALYDAERGGCTKETRGRINEGLGNLLKIMAKHGV